MFKKVFVSPLVHLLLASCKILYSLLMLNTHSSLYCFSLNYMA
ncbi:hypothetical protein X975_07417, partial [Stegodyphus mimosarum]